MPLHSTRTPPLAERRSASRNRWGHTVIDELHWLRDRETDAVLTHLGAENSYAEAVLASTESLQATLYDEIKGRVKETDLSVPIVKDGWSYYARTVAGSDYPIHCRRAVGADGSLEAEQVLFDENIEAGDDDYFELGVFEVSPNHQLLAYAVDRAGDERFLLQFRDIETGVDLPDVIADVSYGSAFAVDNETIFYVVPDEANRPYQVRRHQLGAEPEHDVVVYTEEDERFFCGVGRDKDDRFISISASSAITDEVWLVPAADPTATPLLVEARSTGIEYGLSYHDERFLVLTNAEAQNFRLMSAPLATPGRAHWEEVVAERPGVMLAGFDVIGDHLVLLERTEGITRVSTRRFSDGATAVLDQPESVYTVWAGANPETDTSTFRFGYSSMVSPAAVFTVDLSTGERTLLKETEVLGEFEKSAYATTRTWAEADDGTQVPISLVWRPDRIDGPAPCVLYGYGAYEISVDPTFSTSRLSLLDRGFVFAIAHVRGGGEMGRQWYLDGKFEKKGNSFTDLVACTRHLIAEGWTEAGRVALRGASAGGLLVGAAMNLAPEFYGAVVAQVPFVDALNTILDPTLPLTVTEWEEWGNPEESEVIYDAMASYSPYENVPDGPLPAVLATAGLSDPRVGYWEPAKWVQRLREASTSDNPILLWTDLGAGHGGPSGRYDAWREEAKVLAFLLETIGNAP